MTSYLSLTEVHWGHCTFLFTPSLPPSYRCVSWDSLSLSSAIFPMPWSIFGLLWNSIGRKWSNESICIIAHAWLKWVWSVSAILPLSTAEQYRVPCKGPTRMHQASHDSVVIGAVVALSPEHASLSLHRMSFQWLHTAQEGCWVMLPSLSHTESVSGNWWSVGSWPLLVD